MCVIMIARNTRPTPDMVERAWNANNDGAGIAWQQDGYVYWKKGMMDLEPMLEITQTVPLPYVAHFRIASIGGVLPSLTHPFPIGRNAPLNLEGRTKGGVLFHNGTWSSWSDRGMEATIHSNSRTPVGEWSDSRMMAWLVSLYGPGFMELLSGQKGAIITPGKIQMFTGGGHNKWHMVNDVLCSNDMFTYRSRHTTNYHGKLCKETKCYNHVMPGKEICTSCEDKQKKAADDTKEEHTQSQVQGQTATTIIRQTHITSCNSDPLSKALTLKEAESIFEDKGMSKNAWKKFQSLYGAYKRATTDKKKEKLVGRILRHSTQVVMGLENGSYA